MVKRSRPWALKLATVDGCNRNCAFCPNEGQINGYVDVDLVEEITSQVTKITDKMRVTLSSFGEPLLHPNFLDIVETVNNNIPEHYLNVVTNGDMLNQRILSEYYARGGKMLSVSAYSKNTYEEFRNFELPEEVDFVFSTSTNDFTVYNHHGNKKYFVVMDMWRKQRGNRTRDNRAGKLQETDELKNEFGVDFDVDREKHCMRPFRELALNIHGDVILCCVDWNQEMKFGNVKNKTLKQIWRSEKMETVRYLLKEGTKEGKRIFEPCKNCSYHGSWGPGLEEVDKSKVNLEVIE